MTVKYDDLHQRLLRLLNDPEGKTFSDEACYDAMIAAHNAILPWVPKMSFSEASSGSDGVTVALPAETYIIQTVQDVTTGVFIPRATMAPSTSRRVDSPTQDWIEYPNGYITVSPQMSSSQSLRIYYLGYWDTPANESDTNFLIEAPLMAHTGLVLYSASYCLIAQAESAATLGQFKQRIDSGNPEDNPLKELADWLMARFIQEMKLIPPYTKVGQ